MSRADLDPTVAKNVIHEIGQEFLGESRAAAAVREQIADFLARHRTKRPPPPILLRGEVGVGKSLLARLIHQAGPRASRPFVTYNCAAAIPEILLESELFGLEKVAIFTDERRITTGKLERAHGGTLFLDSVTELPQGLQAKLFKVLERQRFRRVGGTRDQPIDVSILSATDQYLREAIDYRRRYRKTLSLHENFVHLYQQLGKLDLLIPPLRKRPDDILLMAEHCLGRVCDKSRMVRKSLAADARHALLAYPWPGNVREVRAVIERVAFHFAKNDVITAAMLALPESNEPAGRSRRIRR